MNKYDFDIERQKKFEILTKHPLFDILAVAENGWTVFDVLSLGRNFLYEHKVWLDLLIPVLQAQYPGRKTFFKMNYLLIWI